MKATICSYDDGRRRDAVLRGREINLDFALKEMADRVVPDLGVLKVYHPAPILTRTLEFVSGMAANERFGFLASWRRTGFDDHDVDENPNVWLATVVNNREDRVPRSRVFAEILVRDALADRHFLIGTNLNGFLSYLEESWEVYAQEVTLWPDGSSDPNARLDEYVRRFRAPLSPSSLVGRTAAMLKGIGIDADRSKLEVAIDDEQRLRGEISAALAHAQSAVAHACRREPNRSRLNAFCVLIESAVAADEIEMAGRYVAKLAEFDEIKVGAERAELQRVEELFRRACSTRSPGFE